MWRSSSNSRFSNFHDTVSWAISSLIDKDSLNVIVRPRIWGHRLIKRLVFDAFQWETAVRNYLWTINFKICSSMSNTKLIFIFLNLFLYINYSKVPVEIKFVWAFPIFSINDPCPSVRQLKFHLINEKNCIFLHLSVSKRNGSVLEVFFSW